MSWRREGMGKWGNVGKFGNQGLGKGWRDRKMGDSWQMGHRKFQNDWSRIVPYSHSIILLMKKSYDQQFKVVLVGSSGVGKSSLLIRFVDDQFKGDLLATIGVDFRFRTIDVDNKKVKLQIWDTAGQDTFRSIISAYYRGADSIVILFDLNKLSTFNDIRESWKDEIRENKEEYCQVMLIGNKCDLESEERPSEEDIQQLKKDLDTELYFQTSAKQGVDVIKAFTELARTLKKNKYGGVEPITLSTKKEVPVKKGCCKS